MNRIEIPKKSGGTRIIYAVSPDERREFRSLLGQISCPPERLPSAHGFMSGRGIVTAAREHCGATVTISLDLADFFDSVRPDMVRGKIPAALMERVFVDGAPRQGLPTSPAVANLAAEPMDTAIRKALKKSGIERTAYTRYADDLAISLWGDISMETVDLVRGKILDCVRRCGFRENPRKTRIQWASRGRREIVGIMVDDAVHVSRDFRRRLRAAKHNAAKNEGDNRLSRQAMGMAEFAKLTPPCDAAEKARRNDGDRKHREAQQIAREYHVGAPDRILREIPDADLGNGVKITTDPVYFYGMSVLTTGWTSCMSLTRSQHTYKKGVAFWQRLKGASLAYLESDNISSIAGITRPAMAERALVFALRDGRRCYGHIYSGRGHSWDHGSVLATALRSAGYVPARECAGALVVGNVAQHCKLPYFDHAAPETVTLDTSKKKAYRVRMR